MTIPTNNMIAPAKNARCTPATNGPGAPETASKLGSAPMEPMVVTTMAVAMAVLAMLAEFRVKEVSAETIPYRDRSTALRMELLLGEPNRPEPTL